MRPTNRPYVNCATKLCTTRTYCTRGFVAFLFPLLTLITLDYAVSAALLRKVDCMLNLGEGTHCKTLAEGIEGVGIEGIPLVSVLFLLSNGTLRDALDALAAEAGAGVGGCGADVIIVMSKYLIAY